MGSGPDFTEEQKKYLEGFASGIAARRQAAGLAPTGAAVGADSSAADIHRAAQDRTVAAGGKLTAEEKAKRVRHPLDRWDDLAADAKADRFPKGTDVFLAKFFGLFYVAPAENAYMCRLRIPNGVLSSHQMRGVADIAEQFAAGYADVTTRANLQLRGIQAKSAIDVLTALQDLGLTSRGSGADNIRNVTSAPTAGIDPQELIDTRPLGRQMHHHILNHREMYGLPRKFNIAFDGGGSVSVVEDTNDIGFAAVRVADGHGVEPGVYFRLQLGGITGHGDFARDTGVLLKPEECVPVAEAIVRVFTDNGNRTDRAKARLKYVLDAWGFEKFLAETEKHLPAPLTRLPLDACEPRGPIDKHGHVGVHPQRQKGLNWIGVTMPVGRLETFQLRGIADIAERHGSGTIRLTVWQNLLISDVPDRAVAAVESELRALKLDTQASGFRGALVACTGNAGCKFSAADTKGHALFLVRHLERTLWVDRPINIHLTGCHHSCAQHFIADIGLLATKVEVGDETVEGYHIHVGGGSGAERKIGREIFHAVPFADVPAKVEGIVRVYLMHRAHKNESFQDFVARQPDDAIVGLFAEPTRRAA